MTPPKSTIKKINGREISVEWFTYSSAYANTPDFITVSGKSITDTLCVATNVADVTLQGKDTVVLVFIGIPKMHDDAVPIKQSNGYYVHIDTTGTKQRR